MSVLVDTLQAELATAGERKLASSLVLPPLMLRGRQMLDGEAVIAALSNRQLGVVSLGQLAERGVDRSAVLLRTRAGTLVRMHPGVYRLASAPTSWRQDPLAAQLAAGPDGVISHRTAARLHGFGSERGSIIDLSVPRDGRPTVRGPQVRRPRRLEPADMSGLGLPCDHGGADACRRGCIGSVRPIGAAARCCGAEPPDHLRGGSGSPR